MEIKQTPLIKFATDGDQPGELCCSYFAMYLVKNSSTLFSATDYEVAPPEYHRKAV